MRLTLRYRWRTRPLRSFLGFMDLKTGVTIATLFALLNKVAGVYGLIAVFTGGSVAQLTLYIYSICALVVLAWGMKVVSEEDAKRSLYFAHMFFADHIVSTIWTVFFGVVWWAYTPHDGKRVANSVAQEALMNFGNRSATMTDMERADAALRIWNKEKGFAAAVLVIGWCIKIYFALLIYSYAVHLRKGSYRSLPKTIAHQFATRRFASGHSYESDGSVHEDDTDELFLAPVRTPNTGRSSTGSFAEFISGKHSAGFGGRGGRRFPQEEAVPEEVIFDEDERAGSSAAATMIGSVGMHSRLGTDETTSSSDGEEAGLSRR